MLLVPSCVFRSSAHGANIVLGKTSSYDWKGWREYNHNDIKKFFVGFICNVLKGMYWCLL